MRQLTHDISLTQAALNDVKKKVALNQKQTTEAVGALREDMVQHRAEISELLAACQKDIGQEPFSDLHEKVAIMKNELKEMRMILQTTFVQHGRVQEKK